MELARQIKFANFVPNASPCWLNGLPNRIEGGDWGTEAFPGIFLACSLALQAPCMYGTNKNVPVFSHSVRPVLGPLFQFLLHQDGEGWEGKEREDGRGLAAFFKYGRQSCNALLRVCPSSSQNPISRDTCPCSYSIHTPVGFFQRRIFVSGARGGLVGWTWPGNSNWGGLSGMRPGPGVAPDAVVR
ncbi:hypothetical protein V8C43DRAFT_211896 [Trichoderma afarasin]